MLDFMWSCVVVGLFLVFGLPVLICGGVLILVTGVAIVGAVGYAVLWVITAPFFILMPNKMAQILSEKNSSKP